MIVQQYRTDLHVDDPGSILSVPDGPLRTSKSMSRVQSQEQPLRTLGVAAKQKKDAFVNLKLLKLNLH